jgi:hypothetical protein
MLVKGKRNCKLTVPTVAQGKGRTKRNNGVLNGKTRRWTSFEGFQGKNINRTVAGELAAIERSKILRGEAGIGGKKRKDITFEA